MWVDLQSNVFNCYADDSLKATQAMITIGLIFFIASCVAIFVYMFVHNLSYSKALLIKVFCGLSFTAGKWVIQGVRDLEVDRLFYWSKQLMVTQYDYVTTKWNV